MGGRGGEEVAVVVHVDVLMGEVGVKDGRCACGTLGNGFAEGREGVVEGEGEG